MEPTDENLRAWDEAHRARAEPEELPPYVQRTLGDLTKKKVLHLLCGTGEATAALAELGAVATGVDPRPAALEAARE
jgi:SAM-dependent methyltransferase